MRLRLYFLVVVVVHFILQTAPVMAGTLYRFELEDNSVIVGELLSKQNGRFTIRSPTLGTINLEENAIRELQTLNAAGSSSSGPPAEWQTDIQALQRELLGNAALMQSIKALQDDPAIRQALNDPEFMRLIAAGDLQALREHPKFRRLLRHPQIRTLIDQVTGP